MATTQGHLTVGTSKRFSPRPSAIRITNKASRTLGGMLATPGGCFLDADSNSAASGCKLRSMFTDSECFLRPSRAFDTRAAKNVKKVVRRLTYGVWQPRGTVDGPETPTGTTNGPRGQRRQPPAGATCVLCVHLNLRHREGVKSMCCTNLKPRSTALGRGDRRRTKAKGLCLWQSDPYPPPPSNTLLCKGRVTATHI